MNTLDGLNWNKADGLLPVIIQDVQTLQVLMLGYMDQDALRMTQETQRVTFYSRTKQRLWTKGETSGHYLNVEKIIPDCDSDSLLILVTPQGPTCHLNTSSCFAGHAVSNLNFLLTLKNVIEQRQQQPPQESYTAQLLQAGLARIAQKVGEEGLEVALAAAAGEGCDANKRNAICQESADLLYHWLVLLTACDINLEDVLLVLQARNGEKTTIYQ